jgi:hypothetical protein
MSIFSIFVTKAQLLTNNHLFPYVDRHKVRLCYSKLQSLKLGVFHPVVLYIKGGQGQSGGPEDDSLESKYVAPLLQHMSSITTVVFD